jgi:hypothetical protein
LITVLPQRNNPQAHHIIDGLPTEFMSHGRDFAAAIRRAVMLVLMLPLFFRVRSKEGKAVMAH